MEDLFPRKEGLDFSRLKLTEEGSYSITRRRDADRIISLLKYVFNKLDNYTITDATACVGGDTINFARHFSHVHSIEIKEDNFKALANNIEVYELQNVSLYHGDSTVLFNWNTHMLYVDPPWGGKEYRQHAKLELYISGIRLDTWLERILVRKNRPNHIILKLPVNYNFTRFNFLSNVDSIKPYQIRSYVLIIIGVHLPKV